MIDVWEHLVRTLYAIVLGEFRWRRLKITDVSIKDTDLWSYSLDTKLVIMQKLLTVSIQDNHNLICSSLFNSGVISELVRLNQLRNGFKHTSAPITARVARQIEENMADLIAALDQVRGFQGIYLMRFKETSGSMLDLRFETFIGPSTDQSFSDTRITSDQLVQFGSQLNDRCIVAYVGGQFFSVSPFLHFDDDVTRSTYGRMAIYKKRTPSQSNPTFTYEVLGAADNVHVPGSKFATEVSSLSSLLSSQSVSGRGVRT